MSEQKIAPVQPDAGEIEDVQALFAMQTQSPGQAGLTAQTTSILAQNLSPMVYIGTQGMDPQDLGTDRVFLFVPVLDMTGSMSTHRKAVIAAYNAMLDALKDSKQADDILMSSWTFNERSYLLHKYVPLADVPALDKKNYNPDNLTALYDAVLDAITGAVAYGERLRQSGARTKIVLVAFTDGADNTSTHKASEVRTVITDLLAQEMYTFALVTFGGGYAKQVASAMGIPQDNVLEVQNLTPSSIRQALDTVSRSMIRQSQTIINVNAGGFFQP